MRIGRVRLLAGALLFSPGAALAAAPFITTSDSLRSQLGIFENPALSDEASALWTNPAGLGFPRSVTALFSRSMRDNRTYTNILAGWRGGGFGWQRTDVGGGAQLDRWRLAIAAVDRPHGIATGIAVQLAGADGTGNPRYWSADAGVLARPTTWLSAGLVARQLGAPSYVPQTYEAGLAARPFGSSLTVFGGAIWSQGEPARDPSGWHIGGLANLGPGVEVGAAVNQQRAVEVGVTLIFGNGAVGGMGQWNLDGGSVPAWAVLRMSKEFRPTTLIRGGNVGEIRLEGVVRDAGPPFSLFGGQTNSLHALVAQIKRAAASPDIGGLYLRFEGLEIGQGMADELRAALLQYKERTGKPVYAYLASGDVREYYVATAADSIAIEPLGHLDLVGYAAQVVFLRRALDKLGITPDLVRVGQYKSATELFTDSTLSQPYREQLDELLDDYYGALVDAIAAGRDITTDSVRTLIDAGPYTADDALVHGLVDRIAHEDEAFEGAKDLVHRRSGSSGRRVKMASRRPYDGRWGRRPQIAVVFASGDIVTGTGGADIITGSQFVGSETMVKALRAVREDKAIRAVVLRVDSPGGSALASDIIWREVDRLRQAKKPFVISVGDLAASGGYYIACAGDSIVANPGSIVGSIGVFSGKLSLDTLYHKLGIDFAVLKRGENADIWSTTRAFTAEQRAKMQRDVEQGYATFVNRVAAGRGMTTAQVDSIGRGRIWSGERGIDQGLVDKTGGLEDALQMAMRMAGIEGEAEIVQFPRRPTFWEAIGDEGTTRNLRWDESEYRLFYDPLAEMLR